MLHFDRNSVFARFELAGNTICEEVWLNQYAFPLVQACKCASVQVRKSVRPQWRVPARNANASGKGASSPLSRLAAFI